MQHDRRAHERRQVQKKGKLLFINGPCFVECAIMNISEDGALLSMLIDMPLPLHVLLWEEDSQQVFECQVIWRKEHDVGVQFADRWGRAKRHAILEKCFATANRGENSGALH